MPPDDDPEYPREADAWNGVERRGVAPMPKEVGHYDIRKLRALLECIEFSGVDLLDADDKISFTDRLARAKRAEDKRIKRAEDRPKTMLKIVGAVGGGLLTLWLPDVVTWLKAHSPW